MREIPWPCAGIFPYIAAHGTQTVLPRKEIIFAAEQLVIFIENMQGGVKHTGLSEKQSLQLHWIVTMTGKKLKRNRTGEHLERISVQAESERTGQRDEAGGFPVTTACLINPENPFALHLHPFHRKRRHPVCHDQGRESGNVVHACHLRYLIG